MTYQDFSGDTPILATPEDRAVAIRFLGYRYVNNGNRSFLFSAENAADAIMVMADANPRGSYGLTDNFDRTSVPALSEKPRHQGELLAEMARRGWCARFDTHPEPISGGASIDAFVWRATSSRPVARPDGHGSGKTFGAALVWAILRALPDEPAPDERPAPLATADTASKS